MITNKQNAMSFALQNSNMKDNQGNMELCKKCKGNCVWNLYYAS